MITQEQLTDLVGQPVRAADGPKVGDVVHVLVDDTTGRAEWAWLRSDSSGPGDVVVPLRDAVHLGDHVQVPFPAAVIEAAAKAEVQGRIVLSVADEERLLTCFGLRDVRDEVNAEPGTGWSRMDRASDIQAGSGGQEATRTRLRLFSDGAA
ncbi:PRC-barrel domain-containing protein [Streptomyces sp. HMX112]|uniref:PRC-barrel domain-containing protein n=1 Tax=Streptomyces sp. HMX112 TaxID=3390850 RepID=UPI003A80FDB6